MKQQLTVEQLLETIETNKNLKEDVVVKSKDLKFSLNYAKDESMLHFNNIDSSLNRVAEVQLAQKTGLGQKAFQLLKKHGNRANQPHLLDETVNHFLGIQRDEDRLLRLLNGKTRAFLSNNYGIIDNEIISESVFPIIQGELNKQAGAEIESSAITEERLYLKVSFANLFDDVNRKVGQPIRAGVKIVNSEVGMGNLIIAPFVKVLSCTNGYAFDNYKDSFFRKIHLGKNIDKNALLNEVQEAVRNSMDETRFQALVEKFKHLQEIHLEDEETALKVLQTRFQIQKTELKLVQEHLRQEAELTAFNLAQAVTRTAQDLESYDRASEFEAFGGELIQLATTGRNSWKQFTAKV